MIGKRSRAWNGGCETGVAGGWEVGASKRARAARWALGAIAGCSLWPTAKRFSPPLQVLPSPSTAESWRADSVWSAHGRTRPLRLHPRLAAADRHSCFVEEFTMTAHADRRLFSPVQVGPHTLLHRVVMAPLTRSRSEQPGDTPGDL